jgi:hypothetical protein
LEILVEILLGVSNNSLNVSVLILNFYFTIIYEKSNIFLAEPNIKVDYYELNSCI